MFISKKKFNKMLEEARVESTCGEFERLYHFLEQVKYSLIDVEQRLAELENKNKNN